MGTRQSSLGLFCAYVLTTLGSVWLTWFLCCTERLSQRRRPRTHAERDGTHGAGVDDGRGLRIVILSGMFTIAEMDADLDVSLSP